MSNQSPADSNEPWKRPADPADEQQSDAHSPASPVSGNPWSTPSGDVLAPEPYRPPAMAEPPEPYQPPPADAPTRYEPSAAETPKSGPSAEPPGYQQPTTVNTPPTTVETPPTAVETPATAVETPGYQPPAPPTPPTFKPGYASLPKPPEPKPLPPTSMFPQQPSAPSAAPSGGYPPQPGPSEPYPPRPPYSAPPSSYPPQQAAGYGNGAGYNPTPPYGAQPGYNAPPSGGYPPPPAGYGAQQGGYPLPQGGYGPPPGYGPPQPGYGQPPRPPKRSNAPIVAVILAVALLLCGGLATAGVLAFNKAKDRAEEAIKPITDFPTAVPQVPNLPTDDPFPTDDPDQPDPVRTGKTISVVYEVTGDGPASIVYLENLGEAPKRVDNATLPWKLETSMQGAALVSVTAVRSSADSGTISCRATVDGEEVAQRTREGTFVTASCLKMVF